MPYQGGWESHLQGKGEQVIRCLTKREVREMRNAKTILHIIQERGERKLPIERVYRLLYNPNLYLLAYSNLYGNKGALTSGITPETADGMSLDKIQDIICKLKQESYRWKPSKRIFIPKKNGQPRPLSIPCWSDKLLQEVIRLILEAYFEPQFCESSHGFRTGRGCHSALKQMRLKGKGSKWFIEGDIQGCFDNINHQLIIKLLSDKLYDPRFIRLISQLLKTGYIEGWKYNKTYSGVPQGSIIGPILTNIVLNELDKFVENKLIPANTKGKRRRSCPKYALIKRQASKARKQGDMDKCRELNKQAQKIPSRDTNDPKYRRLWYIRYANDTLLGYIGKKEEAIKIKEQIADFLANELHLTLNSDKTLITHAQSQKASFLGYHIRTLQEDAKHDRTGQRCINGNIGLEIPARVIKEHSARYIKRGKPCHLPQHTIDSAYSIIRQYQSEYQGLVQYYRMAYNLHTISKLKYVMEQSLVKTLANKYKTTCNKVYKKYATTIEIEGQAYKVLQTLVEREGKTPLKAHFGGVSTKWNGWVTIDDAKDSNIWNHRSEVVERLLAQKCELCGSTQNIEVHHIRKLNPNRNKGTPVPEWKKKMMARKRKTLIVCQKCHQQIHYGKYDSKPLS